MKIGIFNILALVLAVVMIGGNAKAADGEGKKRAGPGGPAGLAALLLQHADELALTADQKAKLEEMAKGPTSILTDEQKKKVKDIVAASRPAAPEGEGKRMKKKDAPEGEKKPEDKKPEEKKEEKKEDK